MKRWPLPAYTQPVLPEAVVFPFADAPGSGFWYRVLVLLFPVMEFAMPAGLKRHYGKGHLRFD